MKRYLLIFTILAASIISCKDIDPSVACDVADPVENISWLRELVEEFQGNENSRLYNYIRKAEYNGQSVFVVDNCCPMCGSILLVYKCDGTQIAQKDLDYAKVNRAEVVWKSSENTCTFGQ